jgi:Xaa-Pro aminopeptidase
MRPALAALAILLPCALQAGAGAAEPIPREVFSQRRERLLDDLGPGVVLLDREALSGYGAHRQPSTFLYLTGIDVHGASALLVNPRDDGERREILFLPELTEKEVLWDGPRLNPGRDEDERAEARESTGFAEVKSSGAFAEEVRKAIAGHEGATVWLDYRPGKLGEPLSPGLERVREVRDRYPSVTVRSFRSSVVELRHVKDEHEIRWMRGAIHITSEALRRVMRDVKPRMHEYELQAIVEGTFLELGAEGPAFHSIVGSGPNGAVLHYRRNDRRMRRNELVLLDVGARLGGYAADITRTLPVSGRFTERQRELYEIVLEAQNAAIEAVRPGATWAEVHAAAVAVLEEAGHGEHFPHKTSHWLGLDVHDVGDRERPLEPGMVLTVEPGIYIPDEELGIRIEDDVLVTEDGAEVLSADLPRDPDALLRAMRR